MLKKSSAAFGVLMVLLALFGCSHRNQTARSLVSRDVDWEKLDAIKLQYQTLYVDIEDMEVLQDILSSVTLGDTPQPAPSGWTFALCFDNKNQAVLTLEKRRTDEFYIVYGDLEYKVTACGSELYEYCLDTFHQKGFAIDP